MKHLFRISPFTLPFFVIIALSPLKTYYFKLYFFIFLHELAHLATALLCGEKCNKIHLFPWGCMLSLSTMPSKRKSLLIFMAGPLFNLFLAFLGILPKENLTLALFNLLPVMPLDGGVILNLIFPRGYFTISFFTILFLFLFCISKKLPVFLPAILTALLLTGEKHKIEKSINSRVMSHFVVEKSNKKLYNRIDKL